MRVFLQLATAKNFSHKYTHPKISQHVLFIFVFFYSPTYYFFQCLYPLISLSCLSCPFSSAICLPLSFLLGAGLDALDVDSENSVAVLLTHWWLAHWGEGGRRGMGRGMEALLCLTHMFSVSLSHMCMLQLGCVAKIPLVCHPPSPMFHYWWLKCAEVRWRAMLMPPLQCGPTGAVRQFGTIGHTPTQAILFSRAHCWLLWLKL